MSVYEKRHEISSRDVHALKRQCPKMASLINFVGEIESYYIPDHFTALVHGVIFQSISFAAATTIWNRFVGLLPVITPSTVSNMSFEEIKAVGLSKSKTAYIFHIASAFIDKTIRTDFESMSNETIHAELQKVSGIGTWTSEMFLIFSLYRKDILSYGDIAIRRGIEWLYGLDHDITKREFRTYERLYEPYKTLASFYLWEITLRQVKKTHNRDFDRL